MTTPNFWRCCRGLCFYFVFLNTNFSFLFCGVLQGDELSQRLQRVRGFIQASSANQGEARTSTPYQIITRLDLTQSSELKQETPSTPSHLTHLTILNQSRWPTTTTIH